MVTRAVRPRSLQLARTRRADRAFLRRRLFFFLLRMTNERARARSCLMDIVGRRDDEWTSLLRCSLELWVL